MRLLDQLFGMEGGYVLDFGDKSFAEFFDAELGVDIDNQRYHAEGGSKAKRLRYFLKITDAAVRIRTLRALWEYREATRQRRQQEDSVPNAAASFEELLTRIGGTGTSGHVPAPIHTAAHVVAELKRQLGEVTALAPQPRGYAFERFLKGLFDAYGLAGRASFKLVGEQIDGSFELAGETYLLEAKWQEALTDAADLRAFNGKAEDKAAWTRGLFISNSGFSEDGLIAFGRGKRVICMDGSDLREMLDRGIAFSEVVARKIRRAAENGQPFARVRDLFP
jgi:restriction endonuclease Mrr